MVPHQARQAMRHREGKARLIEVYSETKQGLEEERADHQKTERYEEPRGGVDAERGYRVVDGTERGVYLDLLGLDNEADDGDDDGKTEDFHDAVGENAQKQEQRALSFSFIQQSVDTLEDGKDGVGLHFLESASG